MRILSLLISMAALVMALLLWSKVNGLKAGMAAPEQHQVVAPAAESEEEHDEPLEVAVYMGRIQNYQQKLWAAGEAHNVELATFYLHEMDEAMEAIADAHVVEDGIDFSAQMRIYGLPVVEDLQARLKKEGLASVHADSEVLANTCNSCHVACDHGFIRVQVPTSVSYPGQDFSRK
ncbi:MAG: hypothetical protein ABI432_11835 [Flavobacteriales bacterium]